MKKSELYTNVLKDILLIEMPEDKKSAILMVIEEHLKPKNSGGSIINPPKEIDGIMNYYCRWHQEYYAKELMVFSNGKSKGYSKKALSRWNKANSDIKKFDGLSTKALLDNNIEGAKDFAGKSKELKENFNKPEFYRNEKGELI